VDHGIHAERGFLQSAPEAVIEAPAGAKAQIVIERLRHE
jgi:hypothetical protein